MGEGHSTYLVLPNEGGPLGIHVVPDYSPLGSEMGLLVQGVESGGRIHRDGRIHVGDRIVDINSNPLRDVAFHRAQELFRNALHVSQSLHLQSTFRAVLEHFQSSFRAISKQFHSIFRAISEQFQSSFRANTEQFQSNFRAVS